MVPSKKKKAHQRIHHYTLSTTEMGKCWKITVRFSRSWDYQKSLGIGLLIKGPQSSEGPEREYKLVKVSDDDGKVKEVKIRA